MSLIFQLLTARSLAIPPDQRIPFLFFRIAPGLGTYSEMKNNGN
jgi:hypothetical protein